jgi:hypothetical protein
MYLCQPWMPKSLADTLNCGGEGIEPKMSLGVFWWDGPNFQTGKKARLKA